MADMLMTGKGTERNVNDAIRMYQQAAELGECGAMFIMGQFEKSSNKLKSAYWYGLSHTRGFEHALSGLMDLVYPTHFFSVYDLSIPEEDGDIFEYLMSDRLSASAEEIVLRALTMKSLYEQLL